MYCLMSKDHEGYVRKMIVSTEKRAAFGNSPLRLLWPDALLLLSTIVSV